MREAGTGTVPFEPFGPDSMMWKVNRERLVLLGGPSAAVLQVAHPVVARGVARRSAFREDSMGRLRRTLDAVYTVAFGTPEEVESVWRQVGRRHAEVRGAGYSAFDPGAQAWVMATLIHESVRCYEKFVGRLEVGQKEQLLAENERFGEVFGLRPGLLPRSWEEFEGYWQGMMQGELLGSDPQCGVVARAVVRPQKPWVFKVVSPVLEGLAVEGMSAELASRLGLHEVGKQRRQLLEWGVWCGLRWAPECWRYEGRYLRARQRERR